MNHFFKSTANEGYRLDEWKSGKVNVLFIVGYSGSGKSTLAKKLAKEDDAKLVALDGYFNKLLRKKENKEDIDLDKVGYEKGVKYLLEDNKEERVIFEGGQIRRLNPDILKEYAILFIGTSFITSTFRAIARDFEKEHWEEWGVIQPHVHLRYNIILFSALKKLRSSF